MDNREYIVMLYDFYGELFNNRQRDYFEEYYFNNLSLAEIGDNFGVSRNAIHKVIQGVEDKLKFYEEKLGLYKRNEIICDIINRVDDKELREELERLR